ncbi:MAG TPA: Hsp20/alpha crystallin family protein [Pyrinomonadaceae bacterium]|jgi:HSP20 family protein|nr:Hsp20/alpha crystallin family protein [Pyrinomonadaceae bacterium]
MVKSTGAAGLERIELKKLAERVGKIYSVLREAVEVDVTPLAAFKPPTDVCETSDAVFVRIELPGVTANQIKLALTSEKILIYGEKKKKNPRQKIVSHLCSERNYGRFRRVVPLRWTISVKETTAELKDGVLLIRLPKIKDRRGSEIKIPIKEIE